MSNIRNKKILQGATELTDTLRAQEFAENSLGNYWAVIKLCLNAASPVSPCGILLIVKLRNLYLFFINL